ncbi:hypothetical protein [Streptomyces sp. NPDC096351]|uniref:hypothetical protein n=1 Tax=Streptomyces sp. NPDC096351 TaxID=3366087 RepID=UPI00382B9399
MSPLLASGPLDWSLFHGPLPHVVTGLGILALAWLCACRRKKWWSLHAPLALSLAAAATWCTALIVDDWWRPWPEGLPDEDLMWIGIVFAGILLAAFRLPRLSWPRRGLAVTAAALVALFGLNQVNCQFQQYPTLRAMPGPWQRDIPAFTADNARTLTIPAGLHLADIWNPPKSMPAKGRLTTAQIPGTASGMSARDAYVYLPPAYQTSPRPLLPVVVLMAGQPGSPEDWINSGQLPEIMDTFAAQHDGLAPVVVADPLGSAFTNTLCVDSPIAKAQTYLAHDVPQWIH